MQWIPISLIAMATAGLIATAVAMPITPRHDAEVIEVLPPGSTRADTPRMGSEPAAKRTDARHAASRARQLLDQAHVAGDPRYAGQALAILQKWADPQSAPPDVLLLQATVLQYLHAFEPAALKLTLLTQRDPRHAQAWLTLATVRRVQGRYAASDAACTALGKLGTSVYATACQAENMGLRGQVDAARTALVSAINAPGVDNTTRNWLLTTIAELEARNGLTKAANTAYRAALDASADDYTTLSYADFLIAQGRHRDALSLLKNQRRTDPVLLRLAIAGMQAKTPDGPRDAREMRDRIAQANQRPDAQVLHAREQAMFALWVERDVPRALQLARMNVSQQREPLDLLVLVEAAHASSNATALREAARVVKETGLHDTRIAAKL